MYKELAKCLMSSIMLQGLWILPKLIIPPLKKKLLAIVFALDTFRSYLLGFKVVVFFYHATLKFLLKKPNAKPRLSRWMLLLQEFDIEIKDENRAKNLVADHLSCIM